MTTIVIYDTETTGLPLAPVETQPMDVQPYIVQIHAALIEYNRKSHKVLDTFSTLVSGTPFVPKYITAINGVTMGKLKGQPTWSEVRDRFFDMCNTAGAVCSHNFQFDARMVQLEEKRLGFDKPFQGLKHRCTVAKSREINTDAPSHGLGKLYKHLFGEDFVGAHTAGGDVDATIRVYFDLIKKGAWKK